jgi:soluble lytic murein transglycosylase-like protein
MDRRMTRFFALVFVAVLGTCALAQELGKEAQATAEVTRYIETWAQKYPASRRRALAHVASVAHWATVYDVDPLLVAVIVSAESSWRYDATGAVGEIGLMQLHPTTAAKVGEDVDLATGDGQIHAGVQWLRRCIELCGGDARRGLGAYASGSCSSNWSMLE